MLGVLVCLPSTVVALVVALWRYPAGLAIAAVLLPVLYRYARNIIDRSAAMPWVTGARARGRGRWGILFGHVVPVAAPQLIALIGVSVSVGFGAVLPVEVVADSPGIGQLAWQAALGRDLPLLVTLTAIVTAVTVAANAGAALLSEAIHPAEN